MARIFHLALASEWRAAQETGRYTTSTLGRSLAEEGFIHASRADQWQGVRDRFYADVDEPLVLLVIDTDLLDAPVVDETPPGATETFPHIYGALATDAVVQAIDLDAATAVGTAAPTPSPRDDTTTTSPTQPEHQSFSSLFLGEVFFRLLLASGVLALAVLGTLVGLAIDDDWGALSGFAVGTLAGLPVAVALTRRREAS